ncbi:HD domain-containing protein [Spirochaeta cellobiosiphila]|uniref:HD domain-containing protein n=1 Tax=Spirochaeta cellobiosiphila TaxID=504483 RepID=UPI00041566FC|nr:HD domain-containing protein [Spirochaeta cellobiosiphila]
MHSNHIIHEYFDKDFVVPIRDSLWHHIYLTSEFAELIKTKPFLQLHNIKQLGPTYLVYPGATHTRANHSLGVFHLAKQIIESLIIKPNCPELNIYHVKAFLVAALLHDLGHFPYTHSFKELPLVDHEILTGRIIMNSEIHQLLERIKIKPKDVVSIIDHHHPLPADSDFLLYRNILSGVLDPDKLDYLNRDAFYCGVPYGIQDIDHIFHNLRFHSSNGISLTNKGIMSIENILFSKYQMYKSVYWHPQVRIATALVKKAVYLGLENREINPDNLYYKDDREFHYMTRDLSAPIQTLIQASENPGQYVIHEEMDFDSNNNLHQQLTQLDERHKCEQEIEQSIKDLLGTDVKNQIILDIPENINFEVKFPIQTSNSVIPFENSESVFNKQNVHYFTSSLRKIRLLMPLNLSNAIGPEKSFLAR